MKNWFIKIGKKIGSSVLTMVIMVKSKEFLEEAFNTFV